MTHQEICPHFDACVISAILKTIEVPQVLGYCYGNYHHCRYLPQPARGLPPETRREPAEV